MEMGSYTSTGVTVKPCRACGGRDFWRLVRSDGTPLYEDSPWVCGACHPPVADKRFVQWVEAQPPLWEGA